MADYSELKQNIASVIKSNNRREITGQILQNVLNQMVGSLGENYQLAGFAEPTTNPQQPDQTLFYIAEQAGVYTNFDNITLDDGLSFLMWKNSEWTSHTIGVATHSWVDSNYVSKAFLRQIFRVYDADGFEILPNDTTSIADNIKAMVGLWTNEYLSALGLGDDGQTGAQYLTQLGDVEIDSTTLTDGQVLVYDNGLWVNGQAGGVDMSVVWAALAGNTNEQINASHLTTALTGYVTSSSLSTTLADYVTATALNTALASYASQSWVSQNYVSIAFLNRILRAYDSTDTQVQPNDTTTAIDNLKAMVGLWTEQYLSALGQGNDGGGGGYITTLGQLEDVLLTTPSVGQALVYAEVESGVYKWVNGTAGVDMSSVWTALAGSTNEQIALSHLTTALSGYVTTGGLSTTLADYVTATALSTTLADYVTATSLSTTLASYATQQWVGQNYVSIAFFNRLFAAYDSNDVIINPNDTTTAVDNIKALVGLWTQQYLSALGQGSDSGGGGQGDVTWALLADDTDTRQIALSHLTTALTGYATKSWVSNTLSSYATQTWVGQQGFALTSQIPTNNNQLTNGAGYVTSSGVTSVATGTGLTGGTITSTGTISINSTYQTYISNGNTAYGWGNHAGLYLPLSGGTMSGDINIGNGYYIKGYDESGGGMIFFNGSKTIVGSVGVHSTAATHIRSITGHATIGTGEEVSYNILDSGNSSVSLSGSTLSVKINGTTQSLTDTWRGIQNNLTSSSTTDSLSAYQGYLLANGYARDNTKVPMVAQTAVNLNSIFDTSIIETRDGSNAPSSSTTGTMLTMAYRQHSGNTTPDYASQIFMPAGNDTTKPNSLFFRTSISDSWNRWNEVMTLQNYNEWALPLSGGTMTGPILMGGNNIAFSTGSIYSDYIGIRLASNPYIRLSNNSRDHYIATNSYNLLLGSEDGTYGLAIDSVGGAARFSHILGVGGSSDSNFKLYVHGNAYVSTHLQIGSVRLVYDSTNNAIKVEKSDGTSANFYATGGVSALGAAPNSVGSVSYLGSGSYNANNIYDAYMVGMQPGTNLPSANSYGTLLNFAYRKGFGNTKPDYCSQIYMPAGNDTSYPSSLFYRTSLDSTWHAWRRVDGVSMSDERLKKKIEDVEISVEQIANAPIIRFDWNEKAITMGYDKRRHVGSLAQYWQNCLSEVVEVEYNDYYSMQYGVAALIASITTARKVVDHDRLLSEQAAKISELENKCSFLEREVERLKCA